MTQLVARIPDEIAADVDELVRAGVVTSRSEAVRAGLRLLVDRERRRRTAEQIVHAYRRQPQTEAELGWSDGATRAMIADEPW